MPLILSEFFQKYPQKEAPFMHELRKQWKETRPLLGVKVLHHIPVVTNTLLKIACLIEAGAQVTVTNPDSFCTAQPQAIAALAKEQILFVPRLDELRNESFDLYFDCGAQLHQALGSPNIGAIELTGSGDQLYRSYKLNKPVISIDRTYTKQLETVFGCAESSHEALRKLTKIKPEEKKWLIFGFGKIGRGLAYFCVKNSAEVAVADTNPIQRTLAQNLGLRAVDPNDLNEMHHAIHNAELIITATGTKAAMSKYPIDWFKDKILANLGIDDEFGPQFNTDTVLNDKKPINFILDDPTPMRYIDPEFYLHNIVALDLLNSKFENKVHDITEAVDDFVIKGWCNYHDISIEQINGWFSPREVRC
jgi:adenosylhomocysteinase